MRPSSGSLIVAAALCVSTVSCTAPSSQVTVPVRPAARVPVLAAAVTDVPPGKLGASHGPGCPVPPERLRLIRMNHWGFDGQVHRGELIAHQDAVAPLIQAFGQAFEARFPIRRMRVMAEYGGDDLRSMADDNTSAFNCRPVVGDPGKLSRHAWGDAVDINPVENPYVDVSGTVHPPAGRDYLRREPVRLGMIDGGGVVVRAFGAVGWYWGGRWSNPDYQHFSASSG
ncbi:M15 family metallopeptidase [Streptomyces sp. NPDC090022]|uniref:M15 family metallopeptidase n=1 Tax=Streptomyces sp. NPDC090022 TaxID=3365920 RepID=UPI003809824F